MFKRRRGMLAGKNERVLSLNKQQIMGLQAARARDLGVNLP